MLTLRTSWSVYFTCHLMLKNGGHILKSPFYSVGYCGRSRRVQTLCLTLMLTMVVCLVFTVNKHYSEYQIERYYYEMLSSCEKERYQVALKHNGRFVCQCFPDPQNIDIENAVANFDHLDIKKSEIQPGGWWTPLLCAPREKIAIIVPYRNREEHLYVFLRYIHMFLQKQQREYRIFIIEQNNPELFNRATLLNIGFIEAEKLGPFDCYIFHDVDLLPENFANVYSCKHSPLHLGAYMNKFEYSPLYQDFLGAALAVSREHFLQINGFSNQFFGWGGEDDEAYGRFVQHNILLNRYPQASGKSSMFKHKSDSGNPLNPVRRQLLVHTHIKTYQEDGFQQTNYLVEKSRNETLHTWILVSLKPNPQTSHCPNSCFDTQSQEQATLQCCKDSKGYHYCCQSPREETDPVLSISESFRIVGDNFSQRWPIS